MIITSATLAKINKGFRSLYLEAFQGGAPRVASYAMRATSQSAEEVYGWLGSVPGMRELIGEVVIRNLIEHAYSIPNKEFESTIAVKRSAIERDKLGVYTPLFQAMGTAARQHPDELLANTILGGFEKPCYTGKPFFAANHEPQKGKTKFSNVGTKKLSAVNFRTARENIKSRLNADGRPMNLGLDLVLVVSPKNEALGREILVAELVGGGNTNVDKGTARLEVWPQLAGTPDAWFLFEVGYPVKPFIHQVEVETEFQSLDNPADSHVLLKKEYLHQSYGRYNTGYGLPELVYGSDGSAAA
ncbi:Mu-like prophage major head subunit gpT family protein [Geminisphaera colitermitum]|uniref:Mu-like prophage major head subunit gpT family protein n=1 Tax=Geminisphaera colitermitum TaxID=1148786 RepID=UPI000158CBAA|nr:Mu-like prophage major head subunit gpT family protein [Geminisphaera colitermitum]